MQARIKGEDYRNGGDSLDEGKRTGGGRGLGRAVEHRAEVEGDHKAGLRGSREKQRAESPGRGRVERAEVGCGGGVNGGRD